MMMVMMMVMMMMGAGMSYSHAEGWRTIVVAIASWAMGHHGDMRVMQVLDDDEASRPPPAHPSEASTSVAPRDVN